MKYEMTQSHSVCTAICLRFDEGTTMVTYSTKYLRFSFICSFPWQSMENILDLQIGTRTHTSTNTNRHIKFSWCKNLNSYSKLYKTTNGSVAKIKRQGYKLQCSNITWGVAFPEWNSITHKICVLTVWLLTNTYKFMLRNYD